MSRKENVELRAALRRSLRRSLCEKGYEATTYQAIAKEAGVSRMVVQYYYPHKLAFAVEFLEDLLAACAEVLRIDGYSQAARLSSAETYEMACLYYGSLFSTEGMRSFLFDILKDRELADELMSRHIAWVSDKVGPAVARGGDLSQEQIFAIGGFYEVMYWALRDGREFDHEQMSFSLVNAFVSPQAQIGSAEKAELLSLPYSELIDQVGLLFRSFDRA